jgi:Na+/proline symporter
VVVLLSVAETKLLGACCLPMGFLSLWWRATEAVGKFHRLVAGVVRMWNLHLQQRWRWLWVGVGLVMWLDEEKLLPLFLLTKDINGVLELY